MFGHEAPENGSEGAVLENFCVFSGKLFLKNEIKVKIGLCGVRIFSNVSGKK